MSLRSHEQRTIAPFGRRIARVTRMRHVGEYVVIRAGDSEGPAMPRPGQFYMLSTSERWGGGVDERPYLPRAFSFARAKPLEGGGAALEFVLERVGPGTARLAELRCGEDLALVGPLGVGFRPPEGTRAILVGGGIGIAPLICLEEALGRAVDEVLLGFRGAGHAIAAGLIERDTVVSTDDGSVGRHGLVTDLLAERLPGDTPARVYACGPPAMLEAVRALCADHEVPAELALESGMACGFGACYGCVVPTRTGYQRVCVEGPVFDASDLEPALARSGHA